MRETVDTDLTREEPGSPTSRSDVRIEVVHQMHVMQVRWGSLRLHSFSIEPVDSPSGTATAVLKVACAGSVASMALATAGHLLKVPGWLGLVLTLVPFLLVVVGAGHLIMRRAGAGPAGAPGASGRELPHDVRIPVDSENHLRIPPFGANISAEAVLESAPGVEPTAHDGVRTPARDP